MCVVRTSCALVAISFVRATSELPNRQLHSRFGVARQPASERRANRACARTGSRLATECRCNRAYLAPAGRLRRERATNSRALLDWRIQLAAVPSRAPAWLRSAGCALVCSYASQQTSQMIFLPFIVQEKADARLERQMFGRPISGAHRMRAGRGGGHLRPVGCLHQTPKRC